MARLNAANNATTTLNGSINDSVTSLIVTDASLFPTAPFMITMGNEIMRVTSTSGNTFDTLERAQEGTSATSHTSGDEVVNNWTKGTYEEIYAELDAKVPQYGNTIIVAKTGGEYDVIQDAIDASVSGDTILIYDGTYAENVVTKAGAMTTLVGMGTMGSVVIEANTGNVLSVPSAMMSMAFIKNIKLKSTATGVNTSKLFYGEGTMTTFNSVSFDYNISNGYTEEIIDLEAGSYVFTGCKFDFDSTGTVGGDINYMCASNAVVYQLMQGFGTMSVASTTADHIHFFCDSSSGDNIIRDFSCFIEATTASYAGHIDFLHSTNTSNIESVNNKITLTTPSGAVGSYGQAYHLAGVGGGHVHSTGNKIAVNGFEKNYIGNIASTETVFSHFDDIVAVDNILGDGTYNYVNSPSDGDLQMSGNIIKKLLNITADYDETESWEFGILSASSSTIDITATLNTTYFADAPSGATKTFINAGSTYNFIIDPNGMAIGGSTNSRVIYPGGYIIIEKIGTAGVIISSSNTSFNIDIASIDNPSFHVDFSDASSVTVDGSNHITNVVDSVNSWNGTPSSGTGVEYGITTQNGLNTAKWDTSNTPLSFGDNDIHSNTAGRGMTIIAVVKADNTGDAIMSKYYDGTPQREWRFYTSNVTIYNNLDASGQEAIINYSSNYGEWQILQIEWTPDSGAVAYKNGFLLGNSSYTVATIPSGTANLLMGASDLTGADFLGEIGEIWSFSDTITSDEREAVTSKLGAKWGIDVAVFSASDSSPFGRNSDTGTIKPLIDNDNLDIGTGTFTAGNVYGTNTGDETSSSINTLINAITPTYTTQADSEYPITVPTTLISPVSASEFSGNLLYQAITNGDFASGTTGWTPYYGTGAVADNEYTYTVTSVNSGARIDRADDDAIIGHKYYISGSLMPSYDNYARVTYGGITVAQDPTVVDVWNEIYGVITASATSRFRFYHRTDTEYSVSDTFKMKDMFKIDLTTAFGAGNEPTADEVKSWIGTYWEGFKDTEQQEIYSVGKNLITTEPIDYEQGSLDSAGNFSVSTTRIRNFSFIDVKSNTEYMLSLSGASLTYGFYIYEYDKNGNFTIRDGTVWGTGNDYNWTTNEATVKIKIIIRFLSDAIIYPSEIENVKPQLEVGTTATDYEEHKSSTIVLPTIGANLPNEVCDKIYQNGNNEWVREQNVSDEYTLLSGDIDSLYTTPSNMDVVFCTPPIDNLTVADDYSLQRTVGNFAPRNNATYNTDAMHYTHYSGSGNLYIAVPNGTYANLAAAQADLAGTKIYYQLETPVTTPLVGIGQLLAYENGTIFTTPKGIASKSISMDYATNIASQNEATAKGVVLGGEVPYCSIGSLSNQAVPNATTTVKEWDTIIHNDYNMFDISSDDRITFVENGVYLIIANIRMGSNSTGYRQIAITINGSAISSNRILSIGTSNDKLAISTIYKAEKNDYTTCTLYSTAGTSINAVSDSNTTFRVVKVG